MISYFGTFQEEKNIVLNKSSKPKQYTESADEKILQIA
jgi:hypothetical protein